jgi:branched-chain amino acid transport system substrate-binding protein
MMQAAQELGVMEEVALGTAFVDNVLMPAFFANAIGSDQRYPLPLHAPDNEINDWLVEQTMERHGTPPDLFDADGMNAAILLVEALKATGGDTDAQADRRHGRA